ncbi:MAG TPA: Ig-like domain-containing protein [Candidatus Rubrimentiphilum sp.]|nr:Ig-like domain-containing protein [Candidatus Rubrimentiphilum sp.]
MGKATSSSQILIVFAQPVLPVGELGTPQENQTLAHFSVYPAIPGRFIVLTPRMIGFESESALPKAMRVAVTLRRGLRDLRGETLARDLAWTFETDPISLSNADAAPYATPTPATVSLRPAIHVASNAQLALGSLVDHASFRSISRTTPAAVTERFDSDSNAWVYTVTPNANLRKATDYTLTVAAGVLPAHGNLPALQTFAVGLHTYSPLRLVSAKPTADPLTSTGYPRFTRGDPALVFNNALDQKTFAGYVKVAPPPAPVGQLYSLSDDGTTVAINPYALAARTTYTITTDPKLQDIYGQQLGTRVTASFSSGDLAPYFWAPSGFNMFLATQNLQLQYSAVNLPGNRYSAAYRALHPSDLVYGDETDVMRLLPDPASWSATTFEARPNALAYVNVPLRARIGAPAGLLAYGVTSAAVEGRRFSGTVALTNLGILAQWFPQSGSIMVQHLSNGSPAAGATISVYISHLYDQAPRVATPRPCATGKTDERGFLNLSGAAIEACYAGNRPADEGPQLLTIAQSGGDWTFVRTFEWSGAYDYTLGTMDTTWSNGQPISRGTIFSDRAMYQPGERAWLTAVCYVLQNGSLRGDRNATYSVQVTDPNGNKRRLAAQTTNKYATFSFPIDLSKSQVLGYYTVVATSPAGAEITGSFRVAQFRPPNFSVDLKLDHDFAAAGESVAANGNAQYLFGAPMSGANATLHVTRESTTFTPKGWDDFSFGRQWFWPEQQPDVSGEVEQRSVTLDASGKSSANVTVAADFPYAMTYRVDLEVTDASHLSSSATQSFTAVPGSALIGLRSDYVGTVNKPIAVGVIVTDPTGKSQSGTNVHVELEKMQYSGVTQLVEGGEAARNQVAYQAVAGADLTSESEAKTVTLIPKDPGSYRIRATFSGGDERTATDTQVWVSGPGQAVWGDQNPSQLQLKLDKPQYSSGDTAMVAVASPYNRADLYLSVVRDRVLFKTLVHINGTAPRVRIPITQAMFPNAAVEGVLVRRGAPLSNKKVQGVDSLVRIGMVPLTLDIRPNYLKIRVIAQQAKLEPGARQRLNLELTDLKGRPAQGQFTVIVANDAILRLSGYRPPDLVQTVFAAQPISTRFADNRPKVTLTQPSDIAQKGWGYGGGFLAGAAGTRVRTNFLPLAYFNGSVQTDTSGRASVTFTVPDNLTTWRVMAVAITGEVEPRFGNGEGTFITTKPLVTDPLLPQFARPDDRFSAGLLLLNGTNGQLDARTQGELTGALQFVTPRGQTLAAQQTFAPGFNPWRFSVIALPGMMATMQFRTLAGSSDAFRVNLPIRAAAITESVIDSGSTATSSSIPLQIGSGGTLTITVTGSLLSQAAVPAKRALEAESLTLLPVIANRLSVASSLLAVQNKIGSTGVDAKSEAAHDVTQLAALQRMDGGFAFWPNGNSSDAFASAQTLRTLGYARAIGVSVPQATISRASSYVAGVLADPARADKSCTDSSCTLPLRLAALRALGAAGDRRTEFLQSIFAQRKTLGTAEEAELGVYLQQTPGWGAETDTVARDLAQRVYVTGRYANIQPSSAWYGSLVQAQAAYLEFLVARAARAEDRDRALRALLQQQCRCGWPALSDAAAALEAIVAYSSTESRPPDFTVSAAVDGKTLNTAHLQAYAARQNWVIRSLARGSHTLMLRKTGSGTLHYVVSYDYRLDANAPGRLSGLRVIRTVHPANQQSILATMDIGALQNPFSFPAGNVYDVGLEIAVDHPVDGVIISDPLPAGFEPLDTSFQTTAAYYQPLAQSWQIDYQQIYSDHISAYAQHLDPGVYTLHYLVRSVTPGQYLWPGATASLLDAPEQFGRTAFSSIQI